ncbi:uncharacterized protein ACNLHF_014032 [Anomaloglossus baeobatrachus]
MYDLATIAVFWSDADFSKGVGTTYYQEYTTRDSIVIPGVENIISRNIKIPYTAQWTLKITWENVPAYPAKNNDNKTNTYQAVLTTDGFQAFVLILFKDGGMNWDEIDRYPRPLIGFCSGNKDTFFKNDVIAVNIHRPNLYIGNNSDMRGLWIYQLNNSAMENSRMQCFNWFNNQRENPPQWNSGLLSCPCIYRQAQADSRYRATKAGESSYIKLFRSTFPNWYNASVRCVYYRKNQFLEGFQERTWTFHSLSNNVLDAELQAYDWCCNDVDDPQFCTMYKQKRPPINCQTYRPQRPGWMFGDPHIMTLDGLNYTFNGLGDFILLNASDTDISLVLQGRTVQTEAANATNFQAFAVQYTSRNASVKVEWYLRTSNSIDTFLDGQEVLFSYSEDMEANINDTNLAVFFKNDSSMITATFEGSLSVQVSAQSNMLTAVSSLPNSFLNNTKGLLGTWNNDQSDDFFFNNGSMIPITSSEKDIFYYGMEWKVSENNLFTEPPAQEKDSFTPVFLGDLRNQYEEKYAELEGTCGGKTECIYDALVTNNTELGLATMKVSLQLEETNILLHAAAPLITGSSTIEGFINTPVTAQYSTNGTGVFFSSDPDTNTDIDLTENGNLTWTPTSNDSFTFILIATDSQNLSSSLQLSFVLCACSMESECNYTQTTKVNGSSLSILSCDCSNNYSGDFCETPPDLCADGCFPGASCNTSTGCGACPTGFTGDESHCSDIDECESNSTCSPDALCQNEIGNFTCICEAGFTGDGTQCDDIDECECNSTCSPNANCSNTIGSFICACNDGFSGNGTHCDDIEECETNNICSPNATCSNTIGSFICACNEGFSGNGTHCEDIDECETNNICSPNATCTNTIGSFICACNDTFSGDGYICEPLPPCKNDSDCSPDGTCSNRTGDLLCTCNDGYQGNGSYCADIDECGGKNNCSSDASCNNTEGSYICTCNPGFTGNGTHCDDIDECETHNICPPNATCSNTIGSFTCACNDGFTGNGTHCEDIDECDTNNICSPNATCTNTIGNYTCACNDGFSGDGTQCDDIDECETNNTCSPNANCTNTIGSFICACNDGFSENGTHCEDIDECETNNTCSPNATCTNTIGSFICVCYDGFSGDGYNCEALTPCRNDSDCSSDASCSNRTGDLLCTCNDGYQGNGSYCTDIDECGGKNNCSSDASCNNTEGSYICTCNPGYTGDGIHCDDIDECETNNTCSPNATCTNTIGSFTCACKDGFTGNGTHCDDIDECETNNICSPNATCTNTIGNYTCACNVGFSGNGIHCDDIDECETNNICSPNATCTNTIGNYTCTCNAGFSGNGADCSCIAQCEINHCTNGGTCTILGVNCSPHCTCLPAFTGERCKDAADSFNAELKPDTPQRSVKVRLSSRGNFTYIRGYNLIKGKVQDNMKHLFDNTTSNMTDGLWNEAHDNITAMFTAKFIYRANVTIVLYLNNKLLDDIRNNSSRRKRSTDSTNKIDEFPILIDYVIEEEKLKPEELAKYASCTFEGYKLNSNTLQCVSLCINDTHCQNGATCLLANGNVSCICKPFSIYSTSGPQCEHLSMNLGAFFGILFGALAFLLLLLLGIWLTVRCCRKRKENDGCTDETYQTRFSWRTSLFSSFERLGESDISTLDQEIKSAHLVNWKPHLEKVDSFEKVKIKRPEINTNSLKRE